MNSKDMPPEPEPQNAFESLLRRMKDDPALEGAGLRELMKLDLHVLADGQADVVEGLHEVGNGDTVPAFLRFTPAEGEPFVAVFSSQAALEWVLPQIPKPKGRILVLELPAPFLMHILEAQKLNARINHGLTYSIGLNWQAAAALKAGTITESKPTSEAPKQSTHLFGVETDSLPKNLVEAVRKYCDERRHAVAVYAFVKAKEGSDPPEPDFTELRMILRLRNMDNHFYNDFCLMVSRLLPKHLDFAAGVMTEDNEDGMEFLNRNKPLWPVMPAQ